MFGRLRVIAGLDRGCSFGLLEGQTLRVGRSKANEVHLSDPHVARLHCEVRLEGGKVVLSDAGSGSRTLVNGQPVTRQELQPGDIIRVGDTQLAFQWDRADEQSTQSQLRPLPPGPGGPKRD
jgi:pSer/pThr/pTyr-binding forkhead associated (FHA) protein